ncbi:MAG: hypothetical protein U0936_16290 [Planctomycetaceae bacterium]
MKTPQRAILWELWRTGRSDLMLRLFSLSLMVVAFTLVISNSRLKSSALQPVAGVTVLLLIICSALSSLWLQELDTQQSGFSLRLGFTRPVATAWLVLLPMFYGVATSVVCYVIPVSLFYFVIGTRLPVHGPVLLTAMLNAGCLCAMWSSRNRLEKIAFFALLATGTVWLVRWYVGEVPLGESWINLLGDSVNRSWSVLYDLIVVVAIAAMIGVTIVAVDRQRHEISDERLVSATLDVPGVTSQREAGSSLALLLFRGFVRLAALTGLDQRLAVQAAFELRRCGLVTLGAGLLLPVIVFGLVCLIPLMNPQWNRQPLTWLVAIIVCPMIYQLIGIDAVTGLRGRQGQIDISPFDLIRPLRNDQMASMKLIVVSCASLAGWMIMLASGVIYMVANYGTEWLGSPVEIWKGMTSVTPMIWVAGLCFLAMSIASSSSMLLALALWMDLYSWRMLLLFGAVSVNIALVLVDADHGLRFRLGWTLEACILCVLLPFLSALVVRRTLEVRDFGRSILSVGDGFVAWLDGVKLLAAGPDFECDYRPF